MDIQRLGFGSWVFAPPSCTTSSCIVVRLFERCGEDWLSVPLTWQRGSGSRPARGGVKALCPGRAREIRKIARRCNEVTSLHSWEVPLTENRCDQLTSAPHAGLVED